VDELLSLLVARSLRTGDFVLRSGERADWYIDAKQTTLTADGALACGRAFYKEVVRVGATAIGGMTMGADAPAVAAALVAALWSQPLTAFSVRKEAKDHGQGGRIVGPLQPSDKVLLVEDVTTTGGAFVEALTVVRDFGCDVVGALAVLVRGDRPVDALAAEGVELRSLYSAADFGR
jgi:orotate phosphoribosyltransferase